MPRPRSGAAQAAHEVAASDEFKAGDSVRVWWPPTDDEDRSGYAGMYWPVTILSVFGSRVTVKYDNGEEEVVQVEHLQPDTAPVDFGKEAIPFQVRPFDS
jgi:hypothetical protein